MKIVFISSNTKETHLFIESEIKKKYREFLIVKQNKINFFSKIKIYTKYFLRLLKFKLIGEKNKKFSFFFPKFNNKNNLFLNRNNEELIIESIQDFNPNIILVYSSWLLPKKLYSKYFCLNLHTGISPFYRGSDTTEWAIHESNFYLTGYTILRISDHIDLGKVYSINALYPKIRESYNDFKYRLHFIASQQLLKILNNINQKKIFDVSNLKISDVKKKFNYKENINNYKSNNYEKFLSALYGSNIKNYNKEQKEISNGNFIIYINLNKNKLLHFFEIYENFIRNNFKSINLDELFHNKFLNNHANILFINTNDNTTNQNKNLIFSNHPVISLSFLKSNIYKYSLNNKILYFIKNDKKNILIDLVNLFNNINKQDVIILNLNGINRNLNQNYLYSIEVNENNINDFSTLIKNMPLLN